MLTHRLTFKQPYLLILNNKLRGKWTIPGKILKKLSPNSFWNNDVNRIPKVHCLELPCSERDMSTIFSWYVYFFPLDLLSFFYNVIIIIIMVQFKSSTIRQQTMLHASFDIILIATGLIFYEVRQCCLQSASYVFCNILTSPDAIKMAMLCCFVRLSIAYQSRRTVVSFYVAI